MDSSHSHDGGCCNSQTNYGVQQTLSEMEFERGIWHAGERFFVILIVSSKTFFFIVLYFLNFCFT